MLYQDLLESIGLTPKEAQLYELLLANGPASATAIASKLGFKRQYSYLVLKDLLAKKLVKQVRRGKKTVFEAKHPANLKQQVHNRLEQVQNTAHALDSVLQDMVSGYNLTNHRPGVTVAEGMEGLKLIMADSLKARTEIYSYADIEPVQKYIKELNRQYVKQREKLNKQKKVIVTNSPYNRAYFKKLGPKVTDVRYIDYELPSFNTVMQIYDNKISYITLKPEVMIGIIIEDPLITQMHRSLFEFTWSVATKYQESKP